MRAPAVDVGNYGSAITEWLTNTKIDLSYTETNMTALAVLVGRLGTRPLSPDRAGPGPMEALDGDRPRSPGPRVCSEYWDTEPTQRGVA
jgi:hypothetical protein